MPWKSLAYASGYDPYQFPKASLDRHSRFAIRLPKLDALNKLVSDEVIYRANLPATDRQIVELNVHDFCVWRSPENVSLTNHTWRSDLNVLK